MLSVVSLMAIVGSLVVPVLVTRDLGPVEAVKESAELLKRSWGENLIGNVGLGLGPELLESAFAPKS